MAADYYFKKATYNAPEISVLEEKWKNVPDDSVRKQIAYEHQYLEFHAFLLKQLHVTESGKANSPTWTNRLDLSLRAGAIKAAVLLAASIAEACLRAHAERRTLDLPTDLKRRTMGKVLNAWSPNGVPLPEVAPIWQDLTDLRLARNNIHLHKQARDPNAYFKIAIRNEEVTLGKAKQVLRHIRAITSN